MPAISVKKGPYMPAIFVTIGIKYACNLGSKGDQICLQFQFRYGPFMPVIVSVGDHICLQSRKFLKHLESDRLGSKSYLKNPDCRHIWSLSKLKLQAYLIAFWSKIAGIFGPFYNQNCKHNRSLYTCPWLWLWPWGGDGHRCSFSTL